MIEGAASRRIAGMGLIELLVAMLLTAILLLGLVHLVTAASSATLLQDNQAQLQDSARQVEALLRRATGAAGFSPEPWNTAYGGDAIASSSADSVSPHSDRLAVRGWSDLNCFDNRNPDTGANGRPRFYIRESIFERNGSGHLTRSCRYGPSDNELVTQVRRQGLVPGTESFQLLFGEDSDQDGNIDRWVRAGQWSAEDRVLGIRVGLLLAGPDRVTDSRKQRFDILDTSRTGGSDGRLRTVLELSLAIRGRSG